MPEFNKALAHIEPSASMKLGLAANDPSLLNLSIGIPDLGPPPQIGERVCEFSKSNRFPYIPSKGTLLARTRLANVLFAPAEAPDPERELMLTAGAKFGIYLALKTCTSHGDEVMLMEPYWLSYPPMAISLGLGIRNWQPVVTEEGSLEFDPDWLEGELKKGKVKALILNNPNNPSGKVFSAAFLEKIVAITERYGCWLLVDEVYKHHTFDLSLPTMPKAAHVIRIGSVSKSLSLPGLRLGYISGSAAFVEKADLLTQHLLTCITPISNYIAETLEPSGFEAYRKETVGIYHQRYQEFSALFGDRFFILQSDASFYALVRPAQPQQVDTCQYLRSRFGIIATPGSAYGAMFHEFARICLTVDVEKIRQLASRP